MTPGHSQRDLKRLLQNDNHSYIDHTFVYRVGLFDPPIQFPHAVTNSTKKSYHIPFTIFFI